RQLPTSEFCRPSSILHRLAPKFPRHISQAKGGTAFDFKHYRGMRALRRKAPNVGPEVRKKIGEALCASFRETLRQPIPTRHRDLLRQLEKPQATGNEGGTTPYRWCGSRP